jgi:hypothetical protein
VVVEQPLQHLIVEQQQEVEDKKNK